MFSVASFVFLNFTTENFPKNYTLPNGCYADCGGRNAFQTWARFSFSILRIWASTNQIFLKNKRKLKRNKNCSHFFLVNEACYHLSEKDKTNFNGGIFRKKNNVYPNHRWFQAVPSSSVGHQCHCWCRTTQVTFCWHRVLHVTFVTCYIVVLGTQKVPKYILAE